MSLKDGWNGFVANDLEEIRHKANVTVFWLARLREAFYSGAKAAVNELNNGTLGEAQEEIKHFEDRP